jgi:hypothetical protein
MPGPSLPPFDAAALLRSLEEQLAIYQDVRRFSERQKQLIAAKDEAALLGLLGEKQRLIERVQALAAKSSALRIQWDSARAETPAALRTKIEQAAESLRQILAAIVALEDEGKDAILGARESAGEAITKLQKGKAMHKAYGGPKRPGSGMGGGKQA